MQKKEALYKTKKLLGLSFKKKRKKKNLNETSMVNNKCKIFPIWQSFRQRQEPFN